MAMEHVVSPVLPHEAYGYTSRPLTSEGRKTLQEIDSTISHAKALRSLRVKANEFSMKVERSVETYRKLLELVAQIAALNPGYQLYFRGQTNNWLEGGLDSVLRPGVWRNADTQQAIDEACRELAEASRRLSSGLGPLYRGASDADAVFLNRLASDPLVSWALLQHYGVCGTPLLDVTRSLQVACSFARLGAKHGVGYVYVLALPYQKEAVSTDDNEGLTVMSLLGVTPPSARRPLNQDGYLVTTSDWWRYLMDDGADYSITTHDRPNYFRRVLTVFQISTDDEFYANSGVSDFDSEWLCPKDDGLARALNAVGMSAQFW